MQKRPPCAYLVPQLFQNHTSLFSASISSATTSWPPRTVAPGAICTRPLRVWGIEAGEPPDAGDDRPQDERLKRVLNAEGVPVGGDESELLGGLADHQPAASGIVGRVGLALHFRLQFIELDGVVLGEGGAAGEIGRGIKRAAEGIGRTGSNFSLVERQSGGLVFDADNLRSPFGREFARARIVLDVTAQAHARHRLLVQASLVDFVIWSHEMVLSPA